ncbi:MAG TPA: M48 family metalloprotease [Streptosporangiaceae bacterium]|jgi:Zn-dependent protease with chaperone function|nr:M48 family metalloprotease [Streptosporangiaceae bacterium]
MWLLLFVPLLAPALAAAAARPLAAWLEPRRATWLLAGAAVVLACASTMALALLVAWAAAAAPPLALVGQYSAAVARRGDPQPVLTGAAAALLLAGVAIATALTARRRALALAESYRRAARLRPGRHRVVVVPSPAIEAYALPGWPGRIVLSSAILDALDDRGQAALLAHEQAHLAGQHHLFTTAARLAAAANPLLLPLSRAVDYTTERWADERAAASTGDRHLVAATIGRVALLATAPAPAALGIAGRPVRRVSLAWAGPVPRRVAALLAPPPRPRPVLLVAAAVLVLLAGASALEAARDLHTLLQLARSVG